MTDAAQRAADLLKDHRQSIDRLDAILVYTLAERFKQTPKYKGQLAAFELMGEAAFASG
jgi:chorismate mutase